MGVQLQGSRRGVAVGGGLLPARSVQGRPWRETQSSEQQMSFPNSSLSDSVMKCGLDVLESPSKADKTLPKRLK